MIIEKLTKKGDNVLIKFDDETELLLDLNSVLDKGYRRNDELSEDEIENLKKLSNKTLVKNSAFNYLSRRIHSRGELYQKLKKKNFESEIINETLNELEEKKFLDDEFFANRYAEEKLFRKKWGIEKVRSNLFLKGIKRKTIDEVLSAYSGDKVILENAIFLITKKKKFYSNKNYTEQQMKQKLFSFLRSRGFEYELISKALNVVLEK
ncbi:MAG: regulatory protein RecX [Ignavibacteriae bacterium]|nr:regulatory protein RecX [Ignavibacteriota bacterium]NOG98257.1 regulatory protein RecX [Ignavibacteriota bacterium]